MYCTCAQDGAGDEAEGRRGHVPRAVAGRALRHAGRPGRGHLRVRAGTAIISARDFKSFSKTAIETKDCSKKSTFSKHGRLHSTLTVMSLLVVVLLMHRQGADAPP